MIQTMSERRDSNPRPSPWQGDALPTALHPRFASVELCSSVAMQDISARMRADTNRVKTAGKRAGSGR